MRTSSLERYRSFVKLLCGMAVLMVAATICDFHAWYPPSSSSLTATKWMMHGAPFSVKQHHRHIAPKAVSAGAVSRTTAMESKSTLQGTLDLSVEGDDDGLMGKCVAVRVKGHNGTLSLEDALMTALPLQAQHHQRQPLQVGLIFLDDPDGFISSGKVVNQTGVFHLYHYLEFLLVAYQQLHQLLTERQEEEQESFGKMDESSLSSSISNIPIQLSSSASPIQVPWIYVPLMHAPKEVCGVANGINCRIADLLLNHPTWYGMESNPPWLRAFHEAYHGQHEKRQWDEASFPLDHPEQYDQMQETADLALIVSLRRRDRCNHNGRNENGWRAYSPDFPRDDWHTSLVSELESIPLPTELSLPSTPSSDFQPSHDHHDHGTTTPLDAVFAAIPPVQQESLVVCYVDRQATTRRIPDAEHDWLVQYLHQHPSIRFWHLLMQNYDGVQQLKIASECSVMIGVHGNGLSHLLWMAPHRYLIEMYTDDKPRQGGYQPLSEIMDHTYMALRQGLLVLDATHPDPTKRVQPPPNAGENPYTNGRKLIAEFLERALSEQGIASSRAIHSNNTTIKGNANRSSSDKSTGLSHHGHHHVHAGHVDDWGDTHPRHCHTHVKHIHLSVGRDPQREMTVSFASGWSDGGNPHRPAVVAGVRYGTRPDELEFFQAQEEFPLTYNTTYPADSRKHSSLTDKDLYFSPYQHHITIRNLDPGTTYYYIPVVGKRHHDESSLEQDLFSLTAKSWKDHPTQHLENYVRNGVGKLVYDESSMKSRQRQRRRLAPKPYNGLKKTCPETNRVRSFNTAPSPKQDRQGDEPMVRFGIVGDLGQFTHSQETLDHMFHKNPNSMMDAVLLVGDIAYTNNDHRRWDTFFDFLDDNPIFHTTPLQIATGNHDVEKAVGRSEIFQSYEKRFRMPQVRPAQLGLFNGGGKDDDDDDDDDDNDLDMNEPPYPLAYEWGNAYYSFAYGPAKHIVVSAYSSMEPDSIQYQWLVQELESVDRNETPWVLLTIHVPIYNTFNAHHRDLQIVAAQTHLEPLLVEYSVNVVFSGHIHAYQRTKPVAFGKVVPTGPVHVTVGASGRQCCLTAYQNETPESWIADRDATHYGYGQFAIFNRTHAEWQWIPTSSSSLESEDENKLPPIRDPAVLENQYFLSHAV